MSYSTRAYPVPWKAIEADRSIGIECDEGWQVAKWAAPGFDQKAAIARIVAAVNQHAALVAQRDELLGLLRWAFECAEDEFFPGCPAERTDEYKRITELLANTKAGAK